MKGQILQIRKSRFCLNGQSLSYLYHLFQRWMSKRPKTMREGAHAMVLWQREVLGNSTTSQALSGSKASLFLFFFLLRMMLLLLICIDSWAKQLAMNEDQPFRFLCSPRVQLVTDFCPCEQREKKDPTKRARQRPCHE